jgi:hypothetical protein
MNTDNAGYNYLTLDSYNHRLSQKGGATTAQIDAGFNDPDARNRLVRSSKFDRRSDGSEPIEYQVWEHEYDNWHDKLGVTPSYLVEKCEEKRGRALDPQVKDILNSGIGTQPGLFYNTKPLRMPAADEDLRAFKTLSELPDDVRDKIEAYEAESVRGGEKRAYQGCNLKVADERFPIVERMACNDIMCQPHPIYNAQDLDAFLGSGQVSDANKAKYQQCAKKNYYCIRPVDSTVENNELRHFANGGMGECLFIAVAHYIELAQQLNAYPNAENNTVPLSDYQSLIPWKSGNIISYKAGGKLRRDLMIWLKDNLDIFMDSQYAPGTIDTAMAVTLLEPYSNDGTKILVNIDLTPIKALLKFAKEHKEYAAVLGLDRINKESTRHIYNLIIDLNLHQSANVRLAINSLIAFLSDLYIQSMIKRETYAGMIEIFALSVYLRKNIHVWLVNDLQYVLIPSMSFNYPGSNETINILQCQILSNGRAAGLEHYEIVFPWKYGIPEKASLGKLGIMTIAAFQKKYPVLSQIPSDKVSVALQTLLNSTLEPKVTMQQTKLFDGLEAKGVDVYGWIAECLTTHKEHINLPLIYNLLFQMVVRNVEYFDDEVLRAEHDINDGYDFKLLSVIEKAIYHYVGMDGFVIENLGSHYKEIITDALESLEYEVDPNDDVAANLYVLITITSGLDDKMLNSPAMLTLKKKLICQILIYQTADMYYLENPGTFIGPDIYPNAPIFNVMSLLELMKRYSERINYDAAEQEQEQDQEQEQGQEQEQSWTGSDQDMANIMAMAGKNHINVDTSIELMNAMELPHTLDNWKIAVGL